LEEVVPCVGRGKVPERGPEGSHCRALGELEKLFEKLEGKLPRSLSEVESDGAERAISPPLRSGRAGLGAVPSLAIVLLL
jgi:hypothetical protein